MTHSRECSRLRYWEYFDSYRWIHFRHILVILSAENGAFFSTLLETCSDCYGYPDFFDGPCPTCGNKGTANSPRSRNGGRVNEEFRTMLESKLASTEWEAMVQWARERIGIPPQGLDPEKAQDFLLGAMMNLLLPSMLVHPRLGPEIFDNWSNELLVEVSDEELERGVGEVLSASPSVLL